MSNVAKNRKDLAIAWQVTLAFLISAAVILLPDYSFATDTPIGNIFCTVSTWATGNTGKGLATIAVTIIGIGALLGKVSWGMALIVALGVALVFGASGLVNAFNIGDVPADCNTSATFAPASPPVP